MAQISLHIDVGEPSTEKEFINAVVKAARLQARTIWRRNNSYVPNKGGRPSLEKAVDTACDIVWKEWGGKFPKHNSTADALVKKVATVLDGQARKGKDGKARPKRKDLRTVKKFVRQWIECNLTVEEVPDSWLRRPEGRKIARVLWIGTILSLMLEHKDDPSKVEEIRQTYGRLTDKEWADLLIKNRRTIFRS